MFRFDERFQGRAGEVDMDERERGVSIYSLATSQPHFERKKSLHLRKRFRKCVSGVSGGGFARAAPG